MRKLLSLLLALALCLGCASASSVSVPDAQALQDFFMSKTAYRAAFNMLYFSTFGMRPTWSESADGLTLTATVDDRPAVVLTVDTEERITGLELRWTANLSSGGSFDPDSNAGQALIYATLPIFMLDDPDFLDSGFSLFVDTCLSLYQDAATQLEGMGADATVSVSRTFANCDLVLSMTLLGTDVECVFSLTPAAN